MKKSDCTDDEWAAYKAYQRQWRKENAETQRQKERERARKPEAKAKAKAYRNRPEVKARKRELERARYAAKRAASGKAYTPEEHQDRLERQRVSRTGISKSARRDLLAFQNNCCAICRRPFEKRQIRADHCHDTGQPRGLLCHHCNIIEGMIRSSGIDPTDFGKRITHYLSNPPFSRCFR